MTPHLTTRDGTTVQLGAVLASAGEGVIHEVVGRPELVAKIFHPDLKDLSAKLAKVGAMIATPPEGAVQSDGFVVLTWPADLLYGPDGPVGYAMPRIDTSYAVEIHTLSNPSNRTNPLPAAPQWTPNVTWSHLVNVAANLCLAVDVVHRVNAVIGDFQERNILVNDTTRVTLVDCDSMQFTDDVGHLYPCGVARPEFTAPELAGVNLAATERSKASDLFALAVHIHLLLMAGNHPFLRGQWTGGGEQPDALSLAATGQWAGGPGSALHTHALAAPISFLPDVIQEMFVRAFTHGARNPDRRPTAAEWREALLGIQLRICARGHQIPVEADPCPWCDIDDRRAARRGGWTRHSTSGMVMDQVVYSVASPPLPAYALPAPSPTPPPQAAVSSAGQGPAGSKSAGGGRRNLVGVAAGLGAFVTVLIGALVFLLLADSSPSGDDSALPTAEPLDVGNGVWTETPGTPTTSTTTTSVPPVRPAPPALPPPTARPCGEPVAGRYSHAAAGTLITSCPFAISVRDAVNASGHSVPRTVDAYSPVTKKWYPMTCVQEDVLTCRGGDDAVVYVY